MIDSTMNRKDKIAFRELVTSEMIMVYMIADKFTDNKMTSICFHDKNMDEVNHIYLESWSDYERLKEFSSLHDFDVRESVVFYPDHPRDTRVVTVYGEIDQERKKEKERQKRLEEKKKEIAKQARAMLRRYDLQLDDSFRDGLPLVAAGEKDLGFLMEYLKKLKKDRVDDLILMNRMKAIILEIIISIKKPKGIEDLFEFIICDCIGVYAVPGNAVIDGIIQKLPDTFLKEKIPFLEAHCKKLNECPTPGYFSPEAVYIAKVISDISGKVVS